LIHLTSSVVAAPALPATDAQPAAISKANANLIIVSPVWFLRHSE
jgi:hypothetical protein